MIKGSTGTGVAGLRKTVRRQDAITAIKRLHAASADAPIIQVTDFFRICEHYNGDKYRGRNAPQKGAHERQLLRDSRHKNWVRIRHPRYSPSHLSRVSDTEPMSRQRPLMSVNFLVP